LSIMAAIGERERELRDITDKLLEPHPGSLRSTLDELRTFAVSRLTNIRNLIAHPESVDQLGLRSLNTSARSPSSLSQRLGKRHILLTAT